MVPLMMPYDFQGDFLPSTRAEDERLGTTRLREELEECRMARLTAEWGSEA